MLIVNLIYRLLKKILFLLIPSLLWSCDSDFPLENFYAAKGTPTVGERTRGVFITNEGNFGWGNNATLSFYDVEHQTIHNTLFQKKNKIPIGDVLQSMHIIDSLGYLVVNNSQKIYIINVFTFRLVGTITGFTSPRYLLAVLPPKGYVTNLWSDEISIIDLEQQKRVGKIKVPSTTSTEQMVRWRDKIFVSCYVQDSRLAVINTRTDRVERFIQVGYQPNSLILDKDSMLWVLCGGGNNDSDRTDSPQLMRINPQTYAVTKTFTLSQSNGLQASKSLSINGSGDTLYFLDRAVWKMFIHATELPKTPFFSQEKSSFYALGVDPITSSVYVSDALDYTQAGIIYRLRADGTPVDTFRAGIIPGSFTFLQTK